MKQKIIKIGNSSGIIIPKALITEMDLQTGDTVDVVREPAGQGIYINSKGNNAKAASVSPHFLRVLEKVNKHYGTALKKLANK